MQKYSANNVKKFVSNSDAVSWVKKPARYSDRFSGELFVTHPHIKNSINQAFDFFESPDFNNKLSGFEKEEMWDHVQSAIKNDTSGRTITGIKIIAE